MVPFRSHPFCTDLRVWVMRFRTIHPQPHTHPAIRHHSHPTRCRRNPKLNPESNFTPAWTPNSEKTTCVGSVVGAGLRRNARGRGCESSVGMTPACKEMEQKGGVLFGSRITLSSTVSSLQRLSACLRGCGVSVRGNGSSRA